MSIYSVLAPLAGIGQSIIDARTARRNTDKTIQANKHLAEYQYSRDMDMWNRANTYGAPDAQMQRLKSAGLNPNLVYGSGSATGASPATLPKYSAPDVQYNYRSPVNLGSIMQMYQDTQLRSAQIDNVRANTDLTRERVMTEDQYRQPLMSTQQNKMANEGGLVYDKMMANKTLYKYQSSMYDEDLRRRALQNENQASDILYKKYRNEWMKAGVTGSDHPMLRMIIRGFGAYNDGQSWTDFLPK